MAPDGIPRSPVIGGGDCRTLVLASIPFRSSDVASGDGSVTWRGAAEGADGVRRCFVRYEAERGRMVLELLVGGWWKDDLRLTSGDVGVDEAGDLLEGGVYGITAGFGGIGG